MLMAPLDGPPFDAMGGRPSRIALAPATARAPVRLAVAAALSPIPDRLGRRHPLLAPPLVACAAMLGDAHAQAAIAAHRPNDRAGLRRDRDVGRLTFSIKNCRP
jgi:hypothetical protein